MKKQRTEGFDWRKSPPHLTFLATFMKPRAPDSDLIHTEEHWVSLLGEPVEAAIERFVVQGALVQCSLNQRLGQFTRDELKDMLLIRKLKVSGSKDELIERLIQADRSGMSEAVAGIELLQCSEYGREIVEQHQAKVEEASKHQKVVEEIESQEPVRKITRDELIGKIAKGTALFVLGSLVGGFLEQFSADFYTYLKRTLGFDLFIPPIRNGTTSSTVSGFKLTNQSDSTADVVANYVRYWGGDSLATRHFTIPPRGTEFIDSHAFLEYKSQGIVGIETSSDQLLAGIIVLGLRLKPRRLNLNESNSVQYELVGHDSLLLTDVEGLRFQADGVSVILVVGDAGIDVPFSHAVGRIDIDESFVRKHLDDRNFREGLLFVVIEGNIYIPNIPPRYKDIVTHRVETVLAPLQVQV